MNRLVLRILFLGCCLCPMTVFANATPTVTNVTVSQRTDGSGIVDIYYTLSDADGDKCTVSVLVSDDSGSTWTITPSSAALSGNVGSNISTGRKHILWASKTDLPGEYGSNYRVKITANDGVVDIIPITWVAISDPGFNGQMSKYETTNAQYCQFLNKAIVSGDVIVDGSYIRGANGSNSGADFIGQVYYNLAGPGLTYDGVTNGAAARINCNGSTFTVDNGFENHPVTYVSWYGATAFCNYYGYRLPTEWEWQAVADYDGSYTYGCGTTINNSIANYLGSTHPYGITPVNAFGIYGYGMCDMAGNVWEWTSSISGSNRVLRGGSWHDGSGSCTASFRYDYYPYYTNDNYGFRVCR